MNLIYDNMFFTIVLPFIVPAAIGILLALCVWCLVDFARKKSVKYKYVKYSVIAVCFAVLLYALPFGFNMLSLFAKDENTMEMYARLAVKTSVIPSVKSYMYSNLGIKYFLAYEGSKAIEAFEKANEEPAQHLCILYTIKGDSEKGLEKCSNTGLYQNLAVNYIFQNDYTEALNQINKKFENNKYRTCLDYITRGFIYKKLGQTGLAQKDFKQAFKLCKPEVAKAASANDNYFKELYAKKKQEYKF